MNVTIDERIRQLVFGGFYRHFKHDPAGKPANYFYQVLNVIHIKDAGLSAIVYRPLYEHSPVYQAGRGFDGKVADLWFQETPESYGGKIRYGLIESGTPDYDLCAAQVRMLYGSGEASLYGTHEY